MFMNDKLNYLSHFQYNLSYKFKLRIVQTFSYYKGIPVSRNCQTDEIFMTNGKI